MNEIKKPKDILLATLSNPNSTVMDLLKNDITAENTGLLLPEEYKNLDFIKKIFSNEDGVFDDQKFTSFYKLASDKYADLTNNQAYESLKKELEYSPTSMSSPIGSKKFDVQSNFVTLKNPEQKLIGISGINQVDKSGLTKEEIVQGNKYWDTSLNKWSEKTVEEQGLFDKFFGDTLVIAKWQEDGVDENGIRHRKGDWKTDSSGNYYAETIGGRQLLDAQVISVQDILTKEGSWINKYDFFDSDGETKSVTGTVFKTMAQIAPYLIPGVNQYYGALTASVGLASVLPTFYKSVESLLTGQSDSALSKSATQLENWFKKYDSSKSQAGRSGFWNLESLGDVVASTFGQLYQQRAAASLSKYIIPEKLGQEAVETTLKRNKLAKSLSLGYMAMISASDTYNDALNAGYDERTAGFTSLLSASALYSIMNYNEGVNGLGTWFLDKTTGYNQEVSRSAMTKVLKPLYKEVDDGLKEMGKLATKSATKSADPSKLVSAITKFKDGVKNLGQSLAGSTEGYWKNALVEGVEEVSEEAIQDTIKGMVDTLSWMGLTQKEGSFGGFSNVFSKEGLSRYVSTFVGGGIGGALFEFQRTKIEPMFNPELKEQELNIIDFILRGQTKELVNEVNRFRKSFNDKLSPEIGEYNGEKIFLSADAGKSAGDIIADKTIEYIYAKDAAVSMEMRNGYKDMFDRGNEAFKGVENFSNYIRDEYKNVVSNIVAQQSKINSLKESKADEQEIKKAYSELKDLQNTINGFYNGENYLNYLIQYGAYTDPSFRKVFSNLDIEGYTYNMYGLDYNNLDKSQNPGKITKDKIDQEFADYVKNQKNNTFDSTLKPLGNLYINLLEKNSKALKEWSNNKNQQFWLKTILKEFKSSDEFQKIVEEEWERRQALNNGQLTDKDHIEIEEEMMRQHFDNSRTLIQILKKTPGIFTIQNQFSIGNAAEKLIKNKVIDLNNFSDEEQRIITELINSELSRLPITNINRVALQEFIDSINKRILEGDTSNMYIKKLHEIWQSDSEKDTEDKKSDSWISAYIDKQIALNVLNFKSDTLLEKGKSIIKELQNSEFIDEDLLNTLDKIFNTKQVLLEGLTNLLDEMKFHPEKFNDAKIDPAEQIEQIENLINFVQNNDEEIINALWDILNVPKESGDRDLKLAEYEKNIPDISKSVLIFLEYNNHFEEALKYLDEDVDESGDKYNAYSDYRKIRKTLKVLDENPIKTIVKSIFKQFNNGKESDIFDVLLSSEKNINTIPDITDFLYSLDEEEVFNSAERALNVLSALFGGAASMNPIIRDYLKAYHPERKDTLDKFQELTYADVSNATNYLNRVNQKLNVLRSISKANDYNKNAQDIHLRMNNNKKLVYFYQNGLTVNNKVLIPAREYDFEVPMEKFILEQELVFHSNTKNLSTEEKRKLLDNLIKNFESGNELVINNIKTSDISEDDGINSNYILRRLAQNMDISPEVFLIKYKEAIKDENVNPYFDQETALRYAFNSMYLESEKEDQSLRYLNEKLYEKYSKIDDSDQESTNGYITQKLSNGIHLNYMDGAAGTGKSTISKILFKMLGYSSDDLILTSPIEQKIKDLQKSFLDEEQDVSSIYSPDGLFSQVYEDEETSNKILNLRADLISKLQNIDKELENITESTVIEFKTKLPDSEEEVVYARMNIDVKNTNVAINSFELDSEFFNNFLPEIDPEINKLIILDEATLLDPLTIAILNRIEKNSKIKIVLLGDKTQKGFEVKIKGATYAFNINKFYTNRTPSLIGQIRLNNTGRRDNSVSFYQFTEYFYNGTKEISINENVVNNTKSRLSTSPLKYRRENINDQIILQGDEIVNDKDLFNQILKDISINITKTKDTDNPKTLKILISEYSELNEDEQTTAQEADKNELTALLISYGLTSDQFSFYYENDAINGIQGNEADYVVVYKLKASDNILNIDSDLQSMYTYLTRSKDYTLIYEPSILSEGVEKNNGLFTANKVKSEFDKDIKEYSSSVTQDQDKKTLRLDDIDKLLENLVIPEVETSEIVEDIDKKTPESVDPIIENIEDDDDSDASMDEIIKGNPDKTNTKPKILADYQKWFEDYENGMIFDSYYTRLGVKRNQLDELISKRPTGKEDLEGFVNAYWGEKIGGLTIDEKATWGQVAEIFEAYKFSLIKNNNNLITHYTLNKRTLNEDTDYAYNKPNDKGFGDAKSIYTLGATIATGNNTSFNITLGMVRRYNENGIPEDTYLGKLIRSNHEMTITFDVNNLNQEVFKKFTKSVESKNLKYGNKVFIPVTGMRQYRLDPMYNQDLVGHGNFKKLTLSKILKFGYNISSKYKVFGNSEEEFKKFLEFYNKNRYKKLLQSSEDEKDKEAIKKLKSFYYNRIWVKISKKVVNLPGHTLTKDYDPLWETPIAIYRVLHQYPVDDSKVYGLLNGLFNTYFTPEEIKAKKALPSLKVWSWDKDNDTKVLTLEEDLDNHKLIWKDQFDSLKKKIENDKDDKNNRKIPEGDYKEIVKFLDTYFEYLTDIDAGSKKDLGLEDIIKNAIHILNEKNILDDYFIYSEMVENKDNDITLELNVDDEALQSDRVFESPRFLIDLSIFRKPEDESSADAKQESEDKSSTDIKQEPKLETKSEKKKKEKIKKAENESVLLSQDVGKNDVQSPLLTDETQPIANQEKEFERIRKFIKYKNGKSWQAIEDPQNSIKNYISYLKEKNKDDELEELEAALIKAGKAKDFGLCNQ